MMGSMTSDSASIKPSTAPYTFPQYKLKRCLTTEKTPLVLVACGSFSPISILHLEIFNRANHYTGNTNFEVVGNYLSPVSDAYQKPSLVPAHHRLAMCNLAVENTANLMVDSWEALQYSNDGEPIYTKTVDVLRHFDHEVNDMLGGIQTLDGVYKRAQISLLIGADVALTMSDPNVWAPSDLDQILGVFGAFVVERPAQTEIDQALGLQKKYEKIWIVESLYNDVSSTKIRHQLRNGECVVDLPKEVIGYISFHNLYHGAASTTDASG